MMRLPRACRFAAYRITIYNRGAEPLLVKDVTAEGEVHEVVFACRSGETYSLWFGAAGSPPTADSLPALNAPTVAGAADFVLGPIVANPEYEGWKSVWVRMFPLLFTVIALLALSVFAVAVRKRRIRLKPTTR